MQLDKLFDLQIGSHKYNVVSDSSPKKLKFFKLTFDKYRRDPKWICFSSSCCNLGFRTFDAEVTSTTMIEVTYFMPITLPCFHVFCHCRYTFSFWDRLVNAVGWEFPRPGDISTLISMILMSHHFIRERKKLFREYFLRGFFLESLAGTECSNLRLW